MMGFNSASLRYKFIYLTKNVYHGIAVNSLFADALKVSPLSAVSDYPITFYMIDKYINFIPFSLRFSSIYQQKNDNFQSDVILPTKRLETKWISFNNILFFVDMCSPERNSFLSLSPQDSAEDINQKLDVFLQHCAAIIKNDKKKQRPTFAFPLRAQQVVFHILAGMTIKEIAQELGISDKMVYRERDQLTRRLEMQYKSSTFKRLAMRIRSSYHETWVS
ncbi:TPA: helix-turn-helix transcriptional regulator [Klebsiella oxytoca]